MEERLIELREKIKTTQQLLKIDELKIKMDQLSKEMSSAGFWSDQKNAQTISQDYQDIKKEVDKWVEIEDKVNELIELDSSGDKSISKEIESQTAVLEKQFTEYEFFLLLNGPYDQNNAIVAVHAGSGGTEAQDWAEMLVRILFRFSEKQG